MESKINVCTHTTIKIKHYTWKWRTHRSYSIGVLYFFFLFQILWCANDSRILFLLFFQFSSWNNFFVAFLSLPGFEYVYLEEKREKKLKKKKKNEEKSVFNAKRQLCFWWLGHGSELHFKFSIGTEFESMKFVERDTCNKYVYVYVLRMMAVSEYRLRTEILMTFYFCHTGQQKPFRQFILSLSLLSLSSFFFSFSLLLSSLK